MNLLLERRRDRIAAGRLPIFALEINISHADNQLYMLLREAGSKDIKGIVRIYGEVDHEPWDPFGNAELASWLMKRGLFHRGKLIVAQDERTKELAGFAYVRFSSRPYFDPGPGRCAILEELHVRSDYRNEGVGSRLLDEAIKAADSQGISLTYTDVDENNQVASHIYTKRGFKPVHHTLRLRRQNPSHFCGW